jgi:hypothetical protein
MSGWRKRQMIEKQHTTEEWIKTALDELDQYQVRRYAQHLYSVRNALYKALETPSEWVGLDADEFKFIASKYLLNRETGLEYFQEEIEAKLKEKNNPLKEKDIKD